MFKKVRPVIPLLTLCGTLPFLTIGQAQEPAAPVRPDTAPEVKTYPIT